MKSWFGRPASKALLPAVLILLSTAVGLAAASAGRRPAPQWERLPELSGSLGFEGAFMGVSGEALLVAGGSRPASGQSESPVYSDRIFILKDPSAGWSESKLGLTQPVAHGASLTWKDSLLCLGGRNQSGALADAFLLELTADEIRRREVPPLPLPANHFSAALLDNTLYVAFTAVAQAGFWSLDLSHSPNTQSWVELEPGPGLPLTGAVAATQDGSLFLFGGGQPDLKQPRSQYRPLQDATATQVAWVGRGWPTLPHPVVGASVPAVALGQSHLLIPTAGSADGVPDVMAYQTITDTWTDWSGKPARLGGDGEKPYPFTSLAWWQGRVVAARIQKGADPKTLRMVWSEPPTRTAGLHPLDYATLAAYLAVLIGMGFYFSGREHVADDFFLAGQRIPSWACGLSLFGTSISAILLYVVSSWQTVHFFLYGGIGILSCFVTGWLASWLLPDRERDLTGLTFHTLGQ